MQMKWIRPLYKPMYCDPIHYNNITVMVSISIIYSITNRLADSQLFMYFQILTRTHHFSIFKNNSRYKYSSMPNHNPLTLNNWQGWTKRTPKINRNLDGCPDNQFNKYNNLLRLLDKRTFIFCHQTNYSGSVVQDRQALRKMYGPSVLVLER